jgi:16S rRNA (uracil1498-N3)-methyltransferase
MPHRYFSSHIQDGTAFLAEGDAKHLCVVMRAKPGDMVTVCDGHGTDYTCAVRTATPTEAQLEILSTQRSASEPSVSVTLYVGYPKGDKLELIIQKAVELGASRIVPFFSRYCTVTPKKEEQKNIRYNRIALEAAKQSGRGVVPVVDMPLTYAQMLAQTAQLPLSLFCYEAGGEPLLSRLDGAPGAFSIITGSEGGFSPQEAAQALDAGCVPVSLGPRILRCETAPLAALAVAMALTGNLQ